MLYKVPPRLLRASLTLTAPLIMPRKTSSQSKKELEQLLQTREAEYQALAKKLGECSHVLKLNRSLTAGPSTLAQEVQAFATGTQRR